MPWREDPNEPSGFRYVPADTDDAAAPSVSYGGHTDHPGPRPAQAGPDKTVFVKDDLSAYERINPEEFPDFDDVDSREVGEPGGWIEPDGD